MRRREGMQPPTKSELKMVTVPTEEQLERFPGQVALQIVYENFAHDCQRCDLSKTRKKVAIHEHVDRIATIDAQPESVIACATCSIPSG